MKVRLFRITVVGLAGPSRDILKFKFTDLPDGTVIVGDTEKSELKRVFGLLPPTGVVIDRNSFVLVYKFPKPLTREMKLALIELAQALAESAEENGMEADMGNGSKEELLVLRVGRILDPSERGKSIVSVLRQYSKKLEESVAQRAGLATEGSESGREDSS